MTSITAPYFSRNFPLGSSSPVDSTPTSAFSSPFSTASPFTTTSSAPSNGITNSRLITPLAPPPPPPLYKSSHEHGPGPDRQVRYAGADHTLGPTFSEEEDGDDSAFIAAKMAALGLDPNGVPYNQGGFAAMTDSNSSREERSRTPSQAQSQAQAQARVNAQAQAQRQLQLQQLAQIQQAQQQQALVQLIAQQSGQQQLRDTMAILELQQAQQAATDRQYQSQLFVQQQAQRAYLAAQRQSGHEAKRLAQQQQAQLQMQQQQQYLHRLHLQQQLATLQPSACYPPPETQTHHDQRNVLAAQMQANLQARTDRVAQARGMTLDDAQLRARFEAASEPMKSSLVDENARSEGGVYSAQSTASTSPTDSVSLTSPSWRSSQSSSPTKTTTVENTPSSVRSPRGGRFAQARQEMAAAGDSFGLLSAAFSKRVTAASALSPAIPAIDNRSRFAVPSSDISNSQYHMTQGNSSPPATGGPIEKEPQIQQQERTGRYVPGLGFGRPSAIAAAPRSSTNPSKVGELRNPEQTARSVSQPPLQSQSSKLFVVRQPLGPPGEAGELGDKNFQALQARIRRQAGLNLGMLGRRTESPSNTPVVAQG
ncbi:hypothetical protein IAR55_002992 [Kwoniella newhampshirensis]|uniref:Uncharacterized protein n=1 Tax=Kwoniella newhampshirensis TaxID=1651941 RepID=A0AAW0YQR1_9TREE